MGYTAAATDAAALAAEAGLVPAPTPALASAPGAASTPSKRSSSFCILALSGALSKLAAMPWRRPWAAWAMSPRCQARRPWASRAR
ncbi:MAG: hypothetical protein C4K60_11855 [Ideonella sp. MAG2]|nr:MAG: hypothetical protein C4K60_11855 [Ideonella sp. MAG2]